MSTPFGVCPFDHTVMGGLVVMDGGGFWDEAEPCPAFQKSHRELVVLSRPTLEMLVEPP